MSNTTGTAGCKGTLDCYGICDVCDNQVVEGRWEEDDWCDPNDRDEARREARMLDRQRHHYGNDDI